MTPQSIALFEQKEIRKISHDDEWYFSIIDIISVLTDSENSRRYWSDLKIKLREEGIHNELYEKIVQLKIAAPDGKNRETDCANTETILRIIQSVPSPRAEPFKRWLAQVGYERIQEIEDPELAMRRMTETYEAKGYPKEWIDKRMRGIAVRKDLTDEWDNRDIIEQQYGILTAEISRATFGMTPSEYREYKGLAKKSDNLRDHMTDLELIFTMLGEASTTEIIRTKDSKGFPEVKQASKAGGTVAGNARKELEGQTREKVSTKKNYLPSTPKLEKEVRKK